MVKFTKSYNKINFWTRLFFIRLAEVMCLRFIFYLNKGPGQEHGKPRLSTEDADGKSQSAG